MREKVEGIKALLAKSRRRYSILGAKSEVWEGGTCEDRILGKVIRQRVAGTQKRCSHPGLPPTNVACSDLCPFISESMNSPF